MQFVRIQRGPETVRLLNPTQIVDVRGSDRGAAIHLSHPVRWEVVYVKTPIERVHDVIGAALAPQLAVDLCLEAMPREGDHAECPCCGGWVG